MLLKEFENNCVVFEQAVQEDWAFGRLCHFDRSSKRCPNYIAENVGLAEKEEMQGEDFEQQWVAWSS